MRGRLAAIDATTGLVTAWAPALPVEVFSVTRLALHAGAVYTIGQSDGFVGALVPDGTSLLIAGGFTMADGALRDRLARVDDAVGNAVDWHPRLEIPGTWIQTLAHQGPFLAAGAASAPRATVP